ncbi:hypothetical protein Mgra_00010311 [Meloidogyne graminicola]|uniref:FLYWCH-type domain-containing protein n=1 Tax=Meloidogyne graminicola TaxID=189291 RepID=A0A8S9ZAL2_9BILA|nr:hypothetical protein Mgra_00010311 [Meloidogyne graminicola]
MLKLFPVLIIFILIQLYDFVPRKQKNPNQAWTGHLGKEGEGVSMSLIIPKGQYDGQDNVKIEEEQTNNEFNFFGNVSTSNNETKDVNSPIKKSLKRERITIDGYTYFRHNLLAQGTIISWTCIHANKTNVHCRGSINTKNDKNRTFLENKTAHKCSKLLNINQNKQIKEEEEN